MAYFFLTLVYTLFVTLMLPLITYLTIGDIIPKSIFVLILLILCFSLMCGYGYIITKAKHPRKPISMTGMYLPLFLPVIWYLICRGISNILDLSGSLVEVLLGFISFHTFGVITITGFLNLQIPGLSQWHSISLGNLIYDTVLILGFSVGERIAVRKTEAERRPFSYHKKIIITASILVITAYTASEFILFKHRENIVESAHPSYNFSYAGGYSSIDLWPYAVENEDNILAKLEEPSTFVISDPQEMPILDGAEAAYPVYAAFANACYANIGEIQETDDAVSNASKSDTVMPIRFTNTIYAYRKLLSGEVDIFFGARPSQEQLKMAEEAGVELKLTPIGREAFVFFVNEENPVDNLSSEQLRAIYSGQINNWRYVGGVNQGILAFQRPENSGSQTMMEYFMGDTPLREPLEAEYETAMFDTVRRVAEYENSTSSLGYSFRYYTTIMVADTDEEATGIKLLAVDGIYPDTDSIKSGEYPYVTQLYAITVANREDAKSTIELFLDWMIGPQGQQIVSDTGYVAIQ